MEPSLPAFSFQVLAALWRQLTRDKKLKQSAWIQAEQALPGQAGSLSEQDPWLWVRGELWVLISALQGFWKCLL